MSSLTRSQKFQIALCILGVLVASTAQLNELFGPEITKAIVSFAGLGTSVLSGIGAILTGQGQQVQAVVDMAKDDKSPVQGLITTDTPEGKALAASIPGPIVAAGTVAATEMSKS
mgnify:CR=1 FL=1